MTNDTTTLLRDSLQRWAAERYDLAQRRSLLAEGASTRAWRDYADFGWLALRLPEDEGGIDADAEAVGALMEVVGERLLLEPLLASVVLGTGLVLHAASASQRAGLLPALADGSLLLAFADDDDPVAPCELRGGRLTGGKRSVLHGDVAGRLIVSARDADAPGSRALCLADPAAADVQRRCHRLVDGRGAATLRFDGAAVERLGAGDASAAIERARDEAGVALCAEALGVMRRLIGMTCDHLKLRRQFGRPLGDNQVLQHRMVDLFLLQQEVQALTRRAQRCLGDAPAQRKRAVAGAAAYVAAAARRVANEAVQMHGGLGITEESEVSHHFRRVMVIHALLGSRDEQLARFAEAGR